VEWYSKKAEKLNILGFEARLKYSVQIGLPELGDLPENGAENITRSVVKEFTSDPFAEI
jgi:hypothetical protein